MLSIPRRRRAARVTSQRPCGVRCSSATASDAPTGMSAGSDVAKRSGSRFTIVVRMLSAGRRHSTISSRGAGPIMRLRRKKTLGERTWSPRGALPRTCETGSHLERSDVPAFTFSRFRETGPSGCSRCHAREACCRAATWRMRLRSRQDTPRGALVPTSAPLNPTSVTAGAVASISLRRLAHGLGAAFRPYTPSPRVG